MVDLNRQQRVWARELLNACADLPGSWHMPRSLVQEALVEEQVAYQQFVELVEERMDIWDQEQQEHNLKPRWTIKRYLSRPGSKKHLLQEWRAYRAWRESLRVLHGACLDLQQKIQSTDPHWRP